MKTESQVLITKLEARIKALIEVGYSCANSSMVLHDVYRSVGDNENAEICKRLFEEWERTVNQ